MKQLLCAAMAAATLLTTAMAHAGGGTVAGPIKISRTIAYKDDSIGNARVRAECNWNFELSNAIVKESKGRVEATDADLATLPGGTLHIVVTGVHSLGGGAYSGPKWGNIYGELRQDGKLIGNFTRYRTTSRGFSACGSLSLVAKALGEDVAEWLRNPTLDPNLAPAQAAQ